MKVFMYTVSIAPDKRGIRKIFFSYRIQPDYRTYSYEHTVMRFRSLQITARVLFVYFFIKAYVVGTHLNCIDKMQFK